MCSLSAQFCGSTLSVDNSTSDMDARTMSRDPAVLPNLTQHEMNKLTLFCTQNGQNSAIGLVLIVIQSESDTNGIDLMMFCFCMFMVKSYGHLGTSANLRSLLLGRLRQSENTFASNRCALKQRRKPTFCCLERCIIN